MKLAAALLLAAAAFAASVPPRVTRASIAQMEKSIDRSVTALDPDEPSLVLGPTRGVYLEGYGAVFTAEVEIVPGTAPNPFRPEYTKQDILRLRGKKQLRIDILKQKMRETLVAAAAAGPLDSIPLEERIALAVTIPYFSWEDSKGLPRQILMHAPRSVLLKIAKGATLAVENDVKVQEF